MRIPERRGDRAGVMRSRSRFVLFALIVVVAIVGVATWKTMPSRLTTPLTADGGPVEAPDAARVHAVGASCEVDAQCASGLCYPFHERGKRCTQPCEKTADCPIGSTCNRKGYCK